MMKKLLKQEIVKQPSQSLFSIRQPSTQRNQVRGGNANQIMQQGQNQEAENGSGVRKENSGALEILTKTQSQRKEVLYNKEVHHKNQVDVVAAYQIPSGTVSPRFQYNPKKIENIGFEDGPQDSAIPLTDQQNGHAYGQQSSVSVSYQNCDFKIEKQDVQEGKEQGGSPDRDEGGASQKSGGLVSIEPVTMTKNEEHMIKLNETNTEKSEHEPLKVVESQGNFVEFTEIFGDVENCDICGEHFDKHTKDMNFKAHEKLEKMQEILNQTQHHQLSLTLQEARPSYIPENAG